ncbi:hypothetical protein NMG60_11023469 [Bertholletia excelsa]
MMASFLSHSLFAFYLILLSIQTTKIHGAFSEELFEVVALKRMEKITHLHFFFHDILSGKNATAVKIVGTRTGFGTTFMIDDELTEGQERGSKLVGRAQGLYAVASQGTPSLLMVVNYEFLEGKHNGSSVSVLGRNPVFDDVREMPIVGGTGLFRFARGYALAHTVWFDPGTGDATVEYNVYVIHT